MVGVVLTGAVPSGARPHAAPEDEVAGVRWMTAEEALADPNCPPCAGKAEKLRTGGHSPIR